MVTTGSKNKTDKSPDADVNLGGMLGGAPVQDTSIPTAQPLQSPTNSSEIRTNTDIANLISSLNATSSNVKMSQGPTSSAAINPLQATDIVATQINTTDVISGLNQSTVQIMEALNTVNSGLVSGLNSIIAKVESQDNYLSKLEGYGEDTQIKLNELSEAISRISLNNRSSMAGGGGSFVGGEYSGGAGIAPSGQARPPGATGIPDWGMLINPFTAAATLGGSAGPSGMAPDAEARRKQFLDTQGAFGPGTAIGLTEDQFNKYGLSYKEVQQLSDLKKEFEGKGEAFNLDNILKEKYSDRLGTTKITSEGTDIKNRLIQDLRANNYSDIAIAGILASVENESSFDLNAVGDNGASRGLFQWNSSVNRGPADLSYESQFNYLQGELGEGGEFEALGKRLKTATTADEVNEIMAEFEKYQGWKNEKGTEYQERLIGTKRYFTELQSMQPGQQSSDASAISAEPTLGREQKTARLIENYGNSNRSERPDQRILDLVQQAATQVGMDTVTLTSGKGDYISPEGRAKGQKTTMHSTGLAVDISSSSFESEEQKYAFIKAARALGIGGVGTYAGGSVHVDLGSERDWNWGKEDENFNEAVKTPKGGNAEQVSDASETRGMENPMSANMGAGTDSFAMLNQVLGGSTGSIVGELSNMISMAQAMPQMISTPITALSQKIQDVAGRDNDYDRDPSDPVPPIAEFFAQLIGGTVNPDKNMLPFLG